MASGDQGWKRARKRRAYHHQLIKLLKNLQDLPVCIEHRKLLFKRQCFRLKSFALLPLMHFHGQRIGLRQKAKNLPLDIRFLKIGSLVIHMAPTNKKKLSNQFSLLSFKNTRRCSNKSGKKSALFCLENAIFLRKSTWKISKPRPGLQARPMPYNQNTKL